MCWIHKTIQFRWSGSDLLCFLYQSLFTTVTYWCQRYSPGEFQWQIRWGCKIHSQINCVYFLVDNDSSKWKLLLAIDFKSSNLMPNGHIQRIWIRNIQYWSAESPYFAYVYWSFTIARWFTTTISITRSIHGIFRQNGLKYSIKGRQRCEKWHE